MSPARKKAVLPADQSAPADHTAHVVEYRLAVRPSPRLHADRAARQRLDQYLEQAHNDPLIQQSPTIIDFITGLRFNVLEVADDGDDLAAIFEPVNRLFQRRRTSASKEAVQATRQAISTGNKELVRAHVLDANGRPLKEIPKTRVAVIARLTGLSITTVRKYLEDLGVRRT